MNPKYLLSIIIQAYNAEKHISHTVEEILKLSNIREATLVPRDMKRLTP